MSGLRPVGLVGDHPLPWPAPLFPLTLSLSEAKLGWNPNDETRAAEYSKAATKGNWNGVWSSPIVPSVSGAKLSRRLNGHRRKAAEGEQANDAGAAASDEGPGLFGDVGEAGSVAAE